MALLKKVILPIFFTRVFYRLYKVLQFWLSYARTMSQFSALFLILYRCGHITVQNQKTTSTAISGKSQVSNTWYKLSLQAPLKCIVSPSLGSSHILMYF